MSFTFENQGTNTYLVYQVGEHEEIDSMSLGMITNNKILGLAPAVFYQQDNIKYFKYNISAKVSADQFLMGTVNKKRIIGVFTGIVNAMISAEEYMIDANSICLDLEHIYTDVSTCETVLICLPVCKVEQAPVDLKIFFKNIVYSTLFDQTENCDYIAKLINYLNSVSSFSLDGFKDLLENIEKGVQRGATSATAQSTPQTVQQFSAQQNAQPMVEQKTVQSVSQPVTEQRTIQTVQQHSPIQKEPVSQQWNSEEEKEMSWLYLMQHYSKENAAIYKAQKEAKKAAKTNGNPKSKGVVPAPMPERTAPAGAARKPSNVVTPNFAIPGQATPPPTPIQSGKSQIPVQPTPQQGPVQPTPASQPVTQQAQAQQEPTKNPTNFGETTVLSNGPIGETTVLGTSTLVADVKPYLIRSKNNEKILVDKPVFRIGKERSYVDYFINDNTAISRSHANIVAREGEYFLVDTNSTNHTYLNGVMLQSNVETKIAHGAKIRLANEEFEFRLY